MSDIEFTGERFVPGVPGEIAHEHWHRYAFARRFVKGRRTLDVACGEGYGSALLASVAASVVGVDVAPEVVAHATSRYRDRANLRFEAGSAARLPLPDASVDAVVSFETIEHLPREDQSRMIGEIARVLTADGVLILSAPNPVEYSEKRDYRNPFHLHEPGREELEALLGGRFAARRWYRQRRWFGSALWCEETGASRYEAWQGSESGVTPAAMPAAMYAVVIAARNESHLPPAEPALSLFSDASESELARADANAAEILRLDRILVQRDEELRSLTLQFEAAGRRVVELEHAIAGRDARLAEAIAAADAARADAERARVDAALLGRSLAEAVEQRDDARAAIVRTAAQRDEANTALGSARQAVDALREEHARLDRALAAQERIIAYRQTTRWWLALPWHRLRALVRRVRP
ncbi:MAG: methyltransferase domain-containing protein [Burkholderiales bacterium]